VASELNCSPTIIGEEEEVVRAAVEHSASVHEACSNEPRGRSRYPLTGAAMARRVAVCRGAPAVSS
jgi:hypothetical protein